MRPADNRYSTRREFVSSLSGGFGAVGLAAMLQEQLGAAASGPVGPHFAPRAKHVIFLFMTGGPSHMDLFDPKPALRAHAGERPESVDLRTERMTGGLLPSPFEFRRHGQSGIEVSELLPNLGGIVDELCVIRSVYTFNPTHTPARNLIHSGNIAATRPSLGAWISYGLGTENHNLPGFVVLSPGARGGDLWRSGFLPAEHQGTHFNHVETDPYRMIRYLRNDTLGAKAQRRQLDLLDQIDTSFVRRVGFDPRLESNIEAMETAFRMQSEAPGIFDLGSEPAHVRERYGDGEFGRGCLMALRLAEAGVRVVQVYYGDGQPWDSHDDIMTQKDHAERSDGPIASLIEDLKLRGMLDETLVIVGSEFGRTPMIQNSGTEKVGRGRDHNPPGYSILLAGGGIRGGQAYGATDDFGYEAAVNPVTPHDLHATALHLLGLDHTKLTYRYSGRDFRLTDVHGTVIQDWFA